MVAGACHGRYKIFVPCDRLWRAHNNWTFAAVTDVPPNEKGRSWSKCS